MIRILTILLLFSVNSFATEYFVSNSGSDAANGLTPGTSWRTIAKVNSFSFAANDVIRFEKDGVWNEPLIVPRNDLTFSWYGTGSSYPIITGEATLSTWVSTGTNKWRASVPWADSTLTMVTISGVPQSFSRDSAGWKAYTAIDSNTIRYPHTGSWVGKTLVIKSDEWTITRGVIFEDNGTDISFRKWFNLVNGSAPGLGATKSGYKFFLFNDTAYLDTQNEVAFYYPTRHVYIYSSTSPTNVKTTNIDTLFNANLRQNITVRGIRFRYGGLYGIYGSFTTNMVVDSCIFEYMGAQAFGAYRTINLTVQNCTIDQCLQTGIYVQDVTSPYINTSILNNRVTNVGLLFGMGSFGQNPDYSGMGVGAFTGLTCNYNYVNNVGDAGIKFNGNNSEVAYNDVSDFCELTADRSAVYDFIEINTVTDTSFGKKVHHNFLHNGYGNLVGTPQEFSSNPTIRCIGVYADGRNEGWEIYSNTIWNIPGGCLSLNIDSNVTVYDNLCVMTDSNSRYQKSLGVRVQQLRNYPVRFFNYQSNIVFASLSTQKQLQYTAATQSPASIIANFKAIGTINNNFYNLSTVANYQTESGTPYGLGNYTHAQYTSTFGFGVTDTLMPNYALKQCLFLKNPTNSASIKSFTGTYEDVHGTQYTGSITLQPYTSALLFPSTAPPPVTPPIKARIRL